MNFNGKIPLNYHNLRTEFAWMAALQSDHFNIHDYTQVKNYDVIFVIFPKATVKLNRVGLEMESNGIDKDISIYSKPIIETLKQFNKIVCYVQEGCSDFFTDYSITDQFNFYNQLAECDIIFAHNIYDTHFYKGLFPRTKIEVIPSLMFPIDIPPQPEEKVIINGNFASWYNGFQSYIVASDFNCPIFAPSSHCKRPGEEQVPNLKHLPWVMWNEWMKQLSTFKYSVSMMPTIAAGTWSMNCAYYGIPCIGNEKVDTQTHFFPELSVDVHDVHAARVLALRLREDKDLYEQASHHAKKKFATSVHGNIEEWLKAMKNVRL